MRLENTPVNSSTRLWTERSERRHPSRVDYHSELRDWVQHSLLEAEKCKDARKTKQFLSLLRDL